MSRLSQGRRSMCNWRTGGDEFNEDEPHTTLELLADPTYHEPELLQPMLQAVGVTLNVKRMDPKTRTQLLGDGKFQFAEVQHPVLAATRTSCAAGKKASKRMTSLQAGPQQPRVRSAGARTSTGARFGRP
ncbi:MAG: hypothetical protein LC797_07495 [Chloroflexi bacterium]|nr:hypothetical protein [Chloroflexota bacterium]